MKNKQNANNQKNKNCGSKNCGKNCGKNSMQDNEGHSYKQGGNND